MGRIIRDLRSRFPIRPCEAHRLPVEPRRRLLHRPHPLQEPFRRLARRFIHLLHRFGRAVREPVNQPFLSGCLPGRRFSGHDQADQLFTCCGLDRAPLAVERPADPAGSQAKLGRLQHQLFPIVANLLVQAEVGGTACHCKIMPHAGEHPIAAPQASERCGIVLHKPDVQFRIPAALAGQQFERLHLFRVQWFGQIGAAGNAPLDRFQIGHCASTSYSPMILMRTRLSRLPSNSK